jgi:hypothetical protein
MSIHEKQRREGDRRFGAGVHPADEITAMHIGACLSYARRHRRAGIDGSLDSR